MWSFIAPRDSQQPLLVRAAWDRKLTDPSNQHLWQAAEAAPMVGTMTITVPRKPGQRERQATLALRTTVVQMARPAHRSAKTTPTAPPITVVLAREIAPPDERDPIEWLLLTTLPVTTGEEAARIVTWYRDRW